MAYLVLARKWRPQSFDDIVGEETVVRILKNAIRENRVAHAYLFSGPRGIGKTSTARILAKALNCIEGPTVNPCGVCDFCKAITDGSSIDILEIDGASNNSVDNIRDLRERVKYAPSGAKFKVYIIDEAHMLSQSAFNALLKTLEEPPSYVIFVLATTEPDKIINTVLSRCQHLPFRRISSDNIMGRIKMISQSEDFSISDKSVELLAKAADGSMRDALTLLDQILSFTNDIKENDINDMLGISDISSVVEMCEAILSSERKKIIEIINELYEKGTDFKSYIRDLINLVRDILVALITKDKKTLSDIKELTPQSLSNILSLAKEDILTAILQELINAEAVVRYSQSPRIALEMSMIKTSFLSSIRPIHDILSELNQMVKQPSSGVQKRSVSSVAQVDKEEFRETQAESATPTIKEEGIANESNVKEEIEEYGNAEEQVIECKIPESSGIWKDVLEKVYSANHILGCKLSETKTEIKKDRFNIVFSGGIAVHVDSVEKQKKLIETIIKEVTGKRYKVFLLKEKIKARPFKEIEEEVRSKDVIKEALDLFDGKIVDIKPINK